MSFLEKTNNPLAPFSPMTPPLNVSVWVGFECRLFFELLATTARETRGPGHYFGMHAHAASLRANSNSCFHEYDCLPLNWLRKGAVKNSARCNDYEGTRATGHNANRTNHTNCSPLNRQVVLNPGSASTHAPPSRVCGKARGACHKRTIHQVPLQKFTEATSL